jgi:hypothetical protein
MKGKNVKGEGAAVIRERRGQGTWPEKLSGVNAA